MAKASKKTVTQSIATTSASASTLKRGRPKHPADAMMMATTLSNADTDAVAAASINNTTPSSVLRIPAPHSKQGILLTLLQRKQGATIDEMVEATGWQPHSVRGVISGALKKRLGFDIASDKEEHGRVYRVAGTR